MRNIKNFFSFIFSISPRVIIEIFNQLTALLSLPVIINTLNLSEYSFFTFIFFLSHLLFYISNWGIQSHLSEEISKNNFNQNKIIYFLLVFVTLCFSSCLIFIIIFSLSYFTSLKIYISNYQIVLLSLFFVLNMIFNPINILHAMNLINKILIPSIFNRILFLFLIFYFRDSLDLKLTILIFIIPTIFINFYGFVLIFLKIKTYFHFKLSFDLQSIFKLIKKTKNSFILNFFNSYFLIFISCILIFKLQSTQLAVFNFLIQLYRPGIALIEMTMRSSWQVFLKSEKSTRKLIIFIPITLIFIFLITSFYGEFLFNKVIYSYEYRDLWPFVRVILYLLCLETIYYYLIFITLYDFFRDLIKVEKIILSSLFFHLILIIFILSFELSIINIIVFYIFSKIAQIFFILFKTLKYKFNNS